jgi:hypothetical protein
MEEVMPAMATEEQVREDANEVLNACVSYAKRMLRRYMQFAPFAYRMNLEGKVALLLDLLYEQLSERAKKGLLVAAGTASNVTMGKSSQEGYPDAVMVEIEHKDGYCVQAFVPYKITGGQFFRLFPRVVRFGKLRVQDGEPRLFRR